MPDWDVNSPQLQRNLREVLLKIRDQALGREVLSVEAVREWQSSTMRGLTADDARYIGAFRGEKGLEDVEVKVFNNYGVLAKRVYGALKSFERQLQAKVRALDHALPSKAPLNAAMLQAVIELCAWAHAEWIRIHPFANGNGRAARLLANCLAMRCQPLSVCDRGLMTANKCQGE